MAFERRDLGHGIFTHFLLEGLAGRADLDRDGNVDVDEIYRFVSQEVERSTQTCRSRSRRRPARWAPSCWAAPARRRPAANERGRGEPDRADGRKTSRRRGATPFGRPPAGRRAAAGFPDRFPGRPFPRGGKEAWLARFAAGQVLGRDGRPLAATEPCRPHLQVRYFREVEIGSEPDFGPPQILFRSADLVLADKPPFQPVVPSGPWVRSALLYQIAAWLADEGEDAAELAPVHRLDRATAGLVVFARKAATRGRYAKLFEDRQVEKVYEAWAALGEAPAERRWQVRSRIVPGEPFFRMREAAGEPNAQTEIFLREIREVDGRPVGRFELRPLTGKKHQLRLHLAGLGWPILGDRWYPELLPEAPDDPARPLRLLARELAFRDPLSGEELRFRSLRSG